MSKIWELLQKAKMGRDLPNDELDRDTLLLEPARRLAEDGAPPPASDWPMTSANIRVQEMPTGPPALSTSRGQPFHRAKSETATVLGHVGVILSIIQNSTRRLGLGARFTRHLNKARSVWTGSPALLALAHEEEVKLVQQVFLARGKKAPRVVVFCGVESGNGCSWVCTRAGRTLATLVSGNVCVVDANLRSPSLGRYFGLQNERGLTDAILQAGPLLDYLQQLRGSNLWLLTSGPVALDADALLSADSLQARIKELRKLFEYVLIDAPPVNPYVDASLLGRFADGIVLVIEANRTRREIARKARASLEVANLRLLAAVLNKRTYPIPEAVYHKV